MPESEDEFIFAFYMPTTTKILKNDLPAPEFAGMNLGEYLRACEASDHMGWDDPAKMQIVTRIQKNTVTQIENKIVKNNEPKFEATIRISDPREIWKIETEGLNFEKTVRIAYPNLLFGKDGVACSDAEIGICIIWTNKKLTQTGCILPETDVITPQGRVCKFSYSFEPGMITGDLELTVSAYIKKAANVIRSDEEILMNEEGVSIGEIDSVILDFNSIYMEFPIEEYKSDKEPLWWVEFSQWEDPKTSDEFTKDNICLYLNPYYSACPMTDGTIKNVDLLIDILATTYFMIFQRLSDDDLRATRQDIGLQSNSICSILHQFIEDCEEELHFETPERLLKSLQREIRNRLMAGDEE